MTFRYDGVNWEGRDWQTVPAITTLGKQIEQIRPGPATYPTDGTVASKIHDQISPTSDHRPDAEGDVHAIDFGGPTQWLADTLEAMRLSEDERIKYVIHDRRMYSFYPKPGYAPFEWRPYTGRNPHRTHAHVSVRRGDLANDDGLWTLEDDVAQFTEEEAQELRNLVAALKSHDPPSSGWGLGKSAIELIRKERDLPLHDPVTVGDEVLKRGDIVKLGDSPST